ncbi:hypothetical protein V5O48_007342 [Marasmius crinis-equi]|uniref:F-box domain-containing protein n=1 Tax=Marasmius crinis-equi TaxID=585013 RepID=A0ABR3FGX0_9AGAR
MPRITVVPMSNPESNAPNPCILQLPYEIKRQIFADLVDKTGSSASLLAPAASCRVFYDLLLQECSLWTKVMVDPTSLNSNSYPTTIIDTSPDFSASRNVWPGLHTILTRSGDRPVSLGITLAHGVHISPTHISVLMHLLRGSIDRLRDLDVRCAAWEHISVILEYLSKREMPLLEQFRVQYAPGSEQRDNPLVHTLVENSAPSPLVFARDQIGDIEVNCTPVLPSLTNLHLDGIPQRWTAFFPGSLSFLCLRNCPIGHRISCRDLSQILFANRNTLRVLQLGIGALPHETGEPITLPLLTGLWIDFFHPAEIHNLVEMLELPKLQTLAIRDGWNRTKGALFMLETGLITEDEVVVIHEQIVWAYSRMSQRWPLDRVVHLMLADVVFYETVDNPVSSLESSYHEKITWKKRGIPLASRFFYRLSSLRRLYLVSPDETTLQAIQSPPLRYDEESDAFESLHPWLPSLQSCRIGSS